MSHPHESHGPRPAKTVEIASMAYPLLRFAHLLGLTLMGAGLIGVWYSDLRSRQVRELPLLAETIRTVAVLCDDLSCQARCSCLPRVSG